MIRTARRALVAVAMAVTLAGCAAPGGSASASPVSDPTSGASPGPSIGGACGSTPLAATPVPTDANGQPLSPDPKNPSGEGEPNRHAAPEPEALIPQAIAGSQFRVISYRWSGGASSWTALLGRRADEMCEADALPTDAEHLLAGIVVNRIVGVPRVQLRDAMLRSWFHTDVPPAEQFVGGKSAMVGHMTGSPMMCCSSDAIYLYAFGEALFGVSPVDAEAAATVLRALP